MEEKFCQSCGMPMGQGDALYGTEKDGSKSADYCKYCYDKGEFTFHGTVEEMIEICVPHMVQSHPEMSPEQAREMMRQFLPHLKRWK
ncbi:MAG: zinc ribbon domain-containing protein [Candidatus Onthomonas sp.]|nr:zinc ribbon domain-containing protein [Candidatus Onthomonas sp.]